MMVPLAFAVLLTLAAGLSLAGEHTWSPADTGVAGKGDLDGTPGSMGPHNQTEIWKTHITPARDGPTQAGPGPGTNQGVGSRALMGHDEGRDEQHPATDETPR